MRTLSEPWQYIPLFALCLVQAITLLTALFGQDVSNSQTASAFDFAHAIQTPLPSPICYSSPPSFSSQQNPFELDWGKNGAIHLAHRIALPISIAFLFVSFGWWSLIAVENRSILRRLSQENLPNG